MIENVHIKKISIERISEFIDVIKEIAIWLKENKKEMWRIERVTKERLMERHKEADYYLCYVDDEIAGVFMLIEENKRWWPNVKKGESMFLKKFGVRRHYAGKGVSNYIINWVKDKALERKMKYIRIEFFADIEYLCQFYKENGFRPVKEVMRPNNKRIALYEQKI